MTKHSFSPRAELPILTRQSRTKSTVRDSSYDRCILVEKQRDEYPSLWAAIESIAPKIGCAPQTLLEWVKQNEIGEGTR